MSINPEFANFRKHAAEAKDLGRGLEVANFRELTENERAKLRERLKSVLAKVEDRRLDAVIKLDRSNKRNDPEDLSFRLTQRLVQVSDLRERIKEKQEKLSEAEK